MLNLVVGDVHSTPEELPDCEALLTLVHRTVQEYKFRGLELVTFMGDQYNNHDAVSTRCIEFWRRWLDRLTNEGVTVAMLRGNHDQSAPAEAYPHAMLAHHGVVVVDQPMMLPKVGCAAMPYYHDPAEFVADARKLRTENRDVETLFCHQTFDGSRFDNGFYAKDGVQPSDVPFKHVISGHIHTPQKVGQVVYVGAPRWRTKADAGTDRHIWLLEHGPGKLKVAGRVATDTVCSRIWTLDDQPDAPADAALAAVPANDLKRSRVHVDFYGSLEHVRAREATFVAQWGEKCGHLTPRAFPTRQKRVSVSEADGPAVAFGKFAERFEPPHGTDRARLRAEVEARLGP